jgi:D-xylose transport system ATP-binding protein
MSERPLIPPLIEMYGIHKRYGGVQALAGADFTVFPREIHALVGDNAAGKSSLIKALSGAAPADEGVIRFEGRDISIREPRHAKALGIETVYQDLALADNLDIPANIFLGRELLCRGLMAPFMDLKRMNDEAAKLLGRLKIRIPDLRQKVRTLSGGQRQCVGIARAVYFNARVIILDEPTAALGVEETRKVLELVKEMRDQGLTVVMISHNLVHVFDLADRISVMKTGSVVCTRAVRETNREEILRFIVMGREAAA